MPAESSLRGCRMFLSPLAGMVLLLGGLASCSLDYGPDLAETLDDTPSLVFQGLKYRSVEDGEVVYLLDSAKAEEFEERREAKVYEGKFVAYGSEQEVQTEGTAGLMSINQESNDVVLKDNIQFHSKSEETRLTAQELSWQDKPKLLTSPQNQNVKVERGTNSTIEGNGFSLNMRTRTMNFSGPVQGTYRNEEDE